MDKPLYADDDDDNDDDVKTDMTSGGRASEIGSHQRSTSIDKDSHAVAGAEDDDVAMAAFDPAAIRPHLWKLYLSHGMTAWTMRMWEFAVALMLMAVRPDSMLLPAVYDFILSLAVAMSSSLIGRSVDLHRRLPTVQISLLLTKIGFGLASLVVFWSLRDPQSSSSIANSVLIIFFTTIGHLGYMGNRLAVEKDWVVAVVGADDQLLTNTNAILRRIDLSCKLLGPVMAGAIMTGAGMQTGALAIALWNFLSAFPEYTLILHVYKSFPALAFKASRAADTKLKSRLALCFSTLTDLAAGWKEYANQVTVRPGFALAFLYASVLQMASVMTAYAYYRGMSEVVVGVSRGIGAAFGISATVCYPFFVKRYGLVKTGFIAIWTQSQLGQVILLTMSLLSVLVTDDYSGNCSDLSGPEHHTCVLDRNLELGLLFAGTIACRIGLWGYDMAASQMLQKFVPPTSIGRINGTQDALNTLFNMVSPLMGIIFPKPSSFYIIVIASYALVGFGALLYTSFYVAVRDRRLILPEQPLLGSQTPPIEQAQSSLAPQATHAIDDTDDEDHSSSEADSAPLLMH
ncbi:uncharacterized protein MONBRDRAFT_33674 [Monosiga brevicollis MX1]|uniref:Solute carrier family 40 member n=1 Tax=Monosiga brevicollis TaxID=81824 RepID=A9V6H7_MONBE|nr:uncharacterized protein MONBRDRAFT_33674 [Monosiga brevicollis MX1]EDQ86809.1 predicted protein [Monosiga brevicollis MX1]|eukprot:XP_001748354.1 hypothetical protein [Monosiga brevicollis MX1]